MNETPSSTEEARIGEAATGTENSVMPIDVISDVVCPWCYLGKTRLERAIGFLPERRLAVRWHPFSA
jgi:predicted DsbA family dithiol-disulfide isomerase